MRLIDADAFLEEARNRIDMQDMYLPIHIKYFVIDEMPTIDAEPIVRCKDCKYMTEHDCADGNISFWTCSVWDSGTNYDGYCHYGERVEG